MSKAVSLVLERGEHENYGEYANLPVYNAHGNLVGWTGGELPESGHVCEHAVLDEEGFPVCHSSSEIVRLCGENDKLKAENEKLRKFATDLYEYCGFPKGRGCLACKHTSDECETCGCVYVRMARDLGIEVG